MVADSFNYITEISVFIEALRKEGHLKEASLLQDAMDYSSTGAELLMSVRWNIDMLMRNTILSEMTKQRGTCLSSKINELLK